MSTDSRRFISGVLVLVAILVIASEDTSGGPAILTGVGFLVFIASVVLAFLIHPRKRHQMFPSAHHR